MGHPSPDRSGRLPVKLAMARCVFVGSFPACQAMTASTANSGSVCSQARMASANPCEMRNCAASAAQAMTNAERRMLGKVQIADHAAAEAAVVALISFSIIAPPGARILIDEDQQPAEPLVQTHPRSDPRACRRDRDRRPEAGGRRDRRRLDADQGNTARRRFLLN